MQENLNYYEILEIAPDAGPINIKKAYFSQVRKFPPERFPEEFKRIREAYDFLSDEKSRKEYNLALENDQIEDEFSQYFQQGKDAYHEERYDEAHKFFRQALEIRPEERTVWSLIGLCFLEAGEYDQAVSVFKKLTAQFPENSNFHFNLGDAFIQQKDYKKALTSFETSLKLDQSFVHTWVNIGACYLAFKDFEKAREVLKKGIKVCGENLSIYFPLVSLDVLQKDMERLSQDIKKLVKIVKKEPEMKENVAWDLTEMATQVSAEMPDISFKLLEAAKKLDPDKKEIKELYKNISKKIKLQEPLEKLQKDPQVHPWIKDILEGTLGEMFDFLRELDLNVRERLILRDPTNVLSSVEHIKAKHPEIFKKHKKLLQKILDHPKGIKLDEEKLMEDFNQLSDMLSDGSEDDWLSLDEIYIPPLQRINPEKIGRNDPCPCGSGKKYKKCCGG